MFGQKGIHQKSTWIGGWKTPQRRSYFSIQLPHGWWLWSIDIHLDAYIDDAQLRYFEAQKLLSGDRIILCTAKPSWVTTAEKPSANRNLAFFERTVIRPKKARLMLTISGDSHHYAHYAGTGEEPGTHKITAGGGSAFLHPTHDLPEKLSLVIDPEKDEAPQQYELQCAFPTASKSRLLALGAVGLPIANPWFMSVPAVLHVLFLWANQASIRALEASTGGQPAQAAQFGLGDLAAGLVRSPVCILLALALVGMLVAFAQPRKRWEGRGRIFVKTVMRLPHTALHLGAVLVVSLASIRLAAWLADGGWSIFWLFVSVAVLGGVVGAVIVGVYLALCILLPVLKAHRTEAFSSMRLTGYKNFLRLHIDDEGSLHVYPVGLRQVVKHWRLTEGREDASWFAPTGERPDPHLIEQPIVIDGRGAAWREAGPGAGGP